MKTRQKLKQEAKQLYQGKWGQAVALNSLQSGPNILRGIVLVPLAYIFALAIAFPSASSEDDFLILLFAPLMLILLYFPGIILSMALLTLRISARYSVLTWFQTKKSPARIKSSLVCVLTKKYLLGTFVIELLRLLFETGWSLLFIIPGIIKHYSYRQADYIFKDLANQKQTADLKYVDCLNQSRQMMQGHKAEFFVLQLSFLGWDLLEVLTLGIASLWIVPYKNATYAAYYQSLKADYTTEKTVREQQLMSD